MKFITILISISFLIYFSPKQAFAQWDILPVLDVSQKTYNDVTFTDINTIYITAENFKKAVLGHEVAHAVISHYFVVQPSMKVQEVLAGYIEYQLRKTAE